MLRFGKSKVAKKNHGSKEPVKVWNIDIENIVISKPIKMKNNSKQLIGYLNKVKIPLVLILLKMSGYIKTFKD